jgi:hypothetical protein
VMGGFSHFRFLKYILDLLVKMVQVSEV